MKKIMLISLLSLGLVFAPLLGVHAQENDINIYSGAYYTSFADSELADLDDELNIDLSSGIGFKVGGEIGIVPEFGISGEYSRIFNSDSTSETMFFDGEEVDMNIDVNMPINTIRGAALLNIHELMEQDNIPSIKLSGGLGYYFGEMEVTAEATANEITETETESEDFSGIGFKFDIAIEQEVADNFNVNGDIGYRILDLENGDDDFNANGLELGAGISYSF